MNETVTIALDQDDDEQVNNFTSFLDAELRWCEELIMVRLKNYLSQDLKVQHVELPEPQELYGDSKYVEFLKQNSLSKEERLLLILSLVPHLKPQLLDAFFVKNSGYDRSFTVFGGSEEPPHKGLLPTGETALFLLAGTNLHERLHYRYLFAEDHLFSKQKVLELVTENINSPYFSNVLRINDQYLDEFTGLKRPFNHYRMGFPAHPITTELDWNDLVLSEQTEEEVQEILSWIAYGDHLLYRWELRARIKPGFRTVFYGPPGTGKTLTATLLGKATGKQVYRVDIDKVSSKYIGETEKNLAKVFDEAQNHDWILFFDEADALFGKRTQVNSSNDRHANQEVAYLLQRIEDFTGIIILASNLRGNLDDAFTRRFQSTIHFPMPGPKERKRLWNQSFSKHSTLEDAIDLDRISKSYELTGGSVINIVRYCSLETIKRGSTKILLEDLERGIRKELMKEGRSI